MKQKLLFLLVGAMGLLPLNAQTVTVYEDCASNSDTSKIEVPNNQVVLSYCSEDFDAKPNINYTTHICFSCAVPTVIDSVYQGFKFAHGNTQLEINRFNNVLALKQKKPELKILLSFGCFGSEFSILGDNPEYRHQFALDCKRFCDSVGIDGVDLDWEFPGKGKANDPSHDVDNYTKIFKELRSVMPSPQYLITLAGAPKNKEKVDGGYQFVDLKGVEPYVDWINLMCYDYDQGEGRHCPHNNVFDAPSDNGSNSYWSIQRTFTSYRNAGFPMDKLVVGVAFYGRRSFSGSDGGEMMYKNINDVYLKSYKNIYSYKYETKWQVPTLYKNGEFWCSYDDIRSILYKGDWAIKKGWKGIMHWQVAGDNGRCDLQKACWQSQRKWADISVEGNVRTIVIADQNAQLKDTAIVTVTSGECGMMTKIICTPGRSITLQAQPTTTGQFVRWSDGNTDNPRVITAADGMNLTAEFDAAQGLKEILDAPKHDGKYIQNGQLLIRKSNMVYDAQGTLIR